MDKGYITCRELAEILAVVGLMGKDVPIYINIDGNNLPREFICVRVEAENPWTEPKIILTAKSIP